MKINLGGCVSILFCVTVFYSTVSAQPKYSKGYIIMQNNDTLKGEIKTNVKREFDNYTKIAYRKSEGNEIKTFLPKKVKGYFVDSTTFVAKKIEDDFMFVKLLSAGSAAENVYEAQLQYDSMNSTKVASDYYIEKENKDFIKVKSKKAIKIIEDLKAKKQKVEVSDLGL